MIKEEIKIETLTEEYCKIHELTDSRRNSLVRAIEAGADQVTLLKIRDAIRVGRQDTVVIPAHRYELLSRGRGWARKGRGDKAVWGERVDGGYCVGPGKWIVGGNDGFKRKGEDSWTVEHINVGTETWTVAS